MNIKMTYLYRDGGNYKHWQEAVFSNKEEKSVAELTQEIRKSLISGLYFDQSLAPIPIEIDAEYDEELDHSWLEFHRFEEIDESTQVSQDVLDFIARLGTRA